MASANPPGSDKEDVSQQNSGSSSDRSNGRSRAPRKPSGSPGFWKKLGLDPPTLIMMAKLPLPPLIATAMYQSDAVAKEFGTLGYLFAIVSLLSLCILPRAKFLQNLIINCFALSLAAAIALLAIYSSTQARKHTTPPPGSQTTPPKTVILGVPYNSSSSVVCAVWLFVLIYVANTVRGFLPQFTISVILFCIFTVVTLTQAPHIPTMAAGITFVKTLLKVFTSAFALAFAVNVTVIPISSRTVVFKEMTGWFGLCKAALKAQSKYINSLENADMFAAQAESSEEAQKRRKEGEKGKPKRKSKKPSPPSEAQMLKNAVDAVTGMHTKLFGDLPFAKREIAYGKLDGDDIESIFRGLRQILLPLIGMSTVSDIFNRVAERQGWVPSREPSVLLSSSFPNTTAHGKEEELEEWQFIFSQLREPFETVIEAMMEGIDHVMIVFELVPRPKGSKPKTTAKSSEADVEAEAAPKPGDVGFSSWFDKTIQEFYDGRQAIISRWCEKKGLKLPTTHLPSQFADTHHASEPDELDKHQLWLLLYIEHLLYATARAILDMDRLADSKISDGTMSRKKLMFPKFRRLKKWIVSLFKPDDTSPDRDNFDSLESAQPIVNVGGTFKIQGDLEHLPPTSSTERFGNRLRRLAGIMASPESAYGLRAAFATISIGIMAYIRQTASFFIEQRILWALIMISIGMAMTAGSSVFGFFGRIGGTVVAMVFSYINWYIVVGKVPGVIVFLYVFLFLETYFIIKYPRFLIVAVLSMVTQILIIGYELEYAKIGERLTSNGQKYYPTYLLAPYRLACVSGGMFVAFVWTMFPYPITARSQLRKTLGASLFMLANFYSCVHTTVVVRLRGLEGDMSDKASPGKQLEKHRLKAFGKCLLLSRSLHEHLSFIRWEPPIGGKFPIKEYELIIQDVENILNYMAIIGYATKSFSTQEAEEESWIRDFARMVGDVSPTSTDITSLLSLLSGSVNNQQPLPPYLKPPKPYNLSERLTDIDPDILGVNHILEPGYSAFTVMQVASVMIHDDLMRLLDRIRNLVGVVDFSYQVISAGSSTSGHTSQEKLWKAAAEGKHKNA